MKTHHFITWTLLFFTAFACREGNGNSQPGKDKALYVDCKIWGDEEEENVTCLLQFKSAATSNVTVALEAPASVRIDGEPLRSDSANLSGIYYELQKPLATFSGRHTIVYTDRSGRKHKEGFDFTPFDFTTDLPPRMKREQMRLPLRGLKPDEVVRIVLIDTAFSTPDINELDTLENGALVIEKEKLNNLAAGPVTLQLFKEEERPIKQLTAKGGQIAITYGLRRESELTDD